SGASGFWAESVYLGLPVVALACFGLWRFRERRAVLVAGALGLGAFMVALGRFTPVYTALFDYLPFLRTFRYPEKVLPHFCLWASFLAAHGLDALSSEERRQANGIGRWLLILGGGCLALYGFLQIHPEMPGLRSLYRGDATLWGGLSAIIVSRLN